MSANALRIANPSKWATLHAPEAILKQTNYFRDDFFNDYLSYKILMQDFQVPGVI